MVIRKVIKIDEAGGIWYHWSTVHNGKKLRTNAWFVEFGERHDDIVQSLQNRAEHELRQMIASRALTEKAENTGETER